MPVQHRIPAGIAPASRLLGTPQLLAWSLAVACAPALANASSEAAPAPESAAQTLGAVTVTATRRETTLQQVPVAVSVVQGQTLERENRNSVADLPALVPSLTFRTGASNKDTSLFLRGVGTISTSPGVEPSVATVIDGVVLGRPGQATLDLLDVERIEVLRGPQGTLFGKNASAGVLNIVSKPAPEVFGGYVDYSHFGGGDEDRVRASIGGALVPEVLKASVSAVWAEYGGNVRNVADGQTVNGYRRAGARVRLDLTPSPDFSATLLADYLKSHSDAPSGVVVASTRADFAAALAPVRGSADNRQINSDYPTFLDDINKGASLQLDRHIGEVVLTSISAWRQWDNTQFQDGDRTAQRSAAFPASHDRGELGYTQYSQELRVQTPRDRAVEAVAGLYYLHARSDETYRRSVTTPTASNVGVADYDTRAQTYALFGEATWHWRPDLRALLGARVTRDTLEYQHQRVSSAATAVTGIQPSTASAGSTSENGVSGRAGLQYDIDAQTTGYLTYSRGYKGPAYNVFFNMQPRDTPALKPETSNAWELGLKTRALDDRLSANVALFHTDYADYQANFFDTVAGQVVTRLINAGQVRTQGLELDLDYRPTERLSLAASLAYTQARIQRFACPAAAAANCNVDGKPLPFSPDWKGNLRAGYRVPLRGSLAVEFNGDVSWQDSVQYDLSQTAQTLQGPYAIWNASIALADDAHGWRVAVLGRNLGDRTYAPLLANATGNVYRLVPRDDRRYVGVQVHKDF
ncbi:TonB-dependent receptor [Xanthomonas nasturtii]|uniref:TonB-dependent receptor n=1 Tax=Xanthomonas nasturtii TaxID=1843581 RepID=UPI002B22B1F0|nr:TonB-dependent receptor [Xanthomonas nasturtii]MEA9577395.1 TonB-dependent receptor [Xanthomonas nasturtii]